MTLDTFETLIFLTKHEDPKIVSMASKAIENECVYDTRKANIGDIVPCGGKYALVLRVLGSELVTTNGSIYLNRDK